MKWIIERITSAGEPRFPAEPKNLSKLVSKGNFSAKVHVAEDYDTDIERRWWMSGKEELKDLPAGSKRACRAVLTQDFDDRQGDAKTMYRQARDRLSDSEYEVGFFYYRNKIYVGAVARLHALLADDPQYSRRDQACFYLGAALEKLNLAAAAVPYYEKLLAEMPNSKLAPEAKKRLDAIKR